MFVSWLDWFVSFVFAQVAAVAAFMAILHVYAFWTRGRTHFLSELMVYVAAFVAFAVAQEFVRTIPIEVQRAFGLLALALWVHVALMVRQIVRRLMGMAEDGW